jgi:predicted anti-sigma-YlaC factor YlaD
MSEARLDCAGFRAVLDRYFDADFPDRAAFDAHAASCAECRTAFVRITAELADMPCQAFVELVTEYLERSLEPADVARVDRHLELCEGCRAYLQQIHRTIELAGDLPVQPPDPHLRDALVAAYRATRGAE